MCGKDRVIVFEKDTNEGSPPHVRERRVIAVLLYCQVGITPACAGKTTPSYLHSRRTQDHPRMCGKDVVVVNDVLGIQGSPPHVRKRRKRCVLYTMPSRITPACAGKTAKKYSVYERV